MVLRRSLACCSRLPRAKWRTVSQIAERPLVSQSRGRAAKVAVETGLKPKFRKITTLMKYNPISPTEPFAPNPYWDLIICC